MCLVYTSETKKFYKVKFCGEKKYGYVLLEDCVFDFSGEFVIDFPITDRLSGVIKSSECFDFFRRF